MAAPGMPVPAGIGLLFAAGLELEQERCGSLDLGLELPQHSIVGLG